MKQTYEKLLSDSSKAPEVVIFTATWCGPCKLLKPALQSLKADYGFNYTELDIATFSPQELTELGVRNVPTVQVLVNGAVKTQHVGAAMKSKMEYWLTDAGVISRGLSFE
ncbi:thioredoxin family protein [Burkholderia vietnamiensis]|uniref:thioredoxin family protein n=1 Tax=Burkholderia vietnamiensis TaxID=60552 RepID=UPI001CC36DC8|nr:thioredoxin family protein [Burkholderia vietnamiensis]